MQIDLDRHQPNQWTPDSATPSFPWMVGLIESDGALPDPSTGQYSFNSECECPDDCLRDHENE
jgi:hypothetical protein